MYDKLFILAACSIPSLHCYGGMITKLKIEVDSDMNGDRREIDEKRKKHNGIE